MSDLKAVLEDYLESLEGKVSAVSEIVRQQNSHAWKKRRRTSSVDVQAMLVRFFFRKSACAEGRVARTTNQLSACACANMLR